MTQSRSPDPRGLRATTEEDARTTIVLLHALGGNAASWDSVVARLDGFDCLAIDLPGFGDATDDPRVTVEEMSDVVTATIVRHEPRRWLLVGHSMGGKIATIVATRAERGLAPAGLQGVVLLAASPPAPEPIDDARRAAMIGWVEGGPIDDPHARTFVTDNTAGDLPPDLFEAAVDGVRRSARDAWHAWLTRGSREDWSVEVGTVSTPALIVAGGADGDLGEAAQRRLNAPHYLDARIEIVDGAAHLLPLEAPDAVAALIRGHADRVAMTGVPGAYADLLASARVSAKTRAILTERARPVGPDDRPLVLDAKQMATLHALVERIIPDASIDLAARIDRRLATGAGDGWRFAELPEDVEAYRRGLDTLATLDFAGRGADAQDDLLRRMANGDLTDGALSGAQMKMWFEDVRSDAVRLWMSHPATMARIGYDGVANGGDGLRKQGFQRTAANSREEWEPVA